LPDPPKERLVVRVFKHFNDVLIYLLLVAVVVTALLGRWIDSLVIFGVVVSDAVIGFVQEGKADEALEGNRKMLSLDAQVRRDEPADRGVGAHRRVGRHPQASGPGPRGRWSR